MSKRTKKTAEATDSPQQTEPSTEGTERPHHTVDPAVEFDPARLESHPGRPGDTIHLAASTPSIPGPPVLPKIGDTLPDPRSVDQISLSEDRDGPRMRLLRSYRLHEVWIQFDENPGKATTDPIKAAGFRWEPRAEVNDKKGAWVKPLEHGREVTAMLDAERLFKAVGNQFREEKGLEPVGKSGHGTA